MRGARGSVWAEGNESAQQQATDNEETQGESLGCQSSELTGDSGDGLLERGEEIRDILGRGTNYLAAQHMLVHCLSL